jgi:hypothetical protein
MRGWHFLPEEWPRARRRGSSIFTLSRPRPTAPTRPSPSWPRAAPPPSSNFPTPCPLSVPPPFRPGSGGALIAPPSNYIYSRMCSCSSLHFDRMCVPRRSERSPSGRRLLPPAVSLSPVIPGRHPAACERTVRRSPPAFVVCKPRSEGCARCLLAACCPCRVSCRPHAAPCECDRALSW